MVMLQMPGRMQLATLKSGDTFVNSRREARANYRLVARTDAVSALKYIAALPTDYCQHAELWQLLCN